MLVPSGMMLQVIVAGAPLPERVPDAVVVQGAGSFGLIMKPWAEVDRSTTNNGGAHRYLADAHITVGRMTAARASSAMEWRLDNSFYKTGQIVRAPRRRSAAAATTKNATVHELGSGTAARTAPLPWFVRPNCARQRS